MNRRDFLRRSAILAAGAVALSELELLEKLGAPRRLFALGAPASIRLENVRGLWVNGAGTLSLIHNGRKLRIDCTHEKILPLGGTIEILPMGTTAHDIVSISGNGNDSMFVHLPTGESWRKS